ncbi:hypothetical protein D3C80_753500 [compost metagenome]
MGWSQGRDGDIRLAISIEVGHAIFLAVGGICDAVFGMPTPVIWMVDLAPFNIGTKQPDECNRKVIRQHKRPLD